MTRYRFFLLPLAVAGALLLVPRPALTQGDAGKLPPDAEKIGDDLYRLGKAKVDLKAKTLTCGGKINMDRGLIEYLAVVVPGGKRHESLLGMDVRPLHLQLGLILLGLEPKGGLRFQGDSQAPKGSPVEVFVSWQRAGKSVKVYAEDLAWDIPRKQPMERKAWVFSGSAIDANGFRADRELSLIATFRDPDAIVNNALPKGDDDTAYKVNERVVPKWGTPVTLTLSPAS